MTGNGTHGKGRRAGLWIAAVTVAVLALVVVFLVLPAVRRQAFRTVGSVVTFGSYPQQAQGTDRTPIQWQVLDVQGDRALLLSCRGLDTRQYHTEKTETTWAACSLRAWLNGEFLNRAFSGREQAGILMTDVDGSKEAQLMTIAEETIPMIDQLPEEMGEEERALILKEYYSDLLEGIEKIRKIK